MKKQIMEEAKVEIPKGWDAEINRAAKRWLEDEYPEAICPVEDYLLGAYREWYCLNICYKLFPRAEMNKGCPCDILDLEEVKSRVEKVVEKWEEKWAIITF